MKKQIGVLLASFLILLLGWAILPAPAMPSDDPPEEDIAGSDWRTWGIIDDSGTLVQDGETIPFCACVHTGDTTLYHDTESQVLLAGWTTLPLWRMQNSATSAWRPQTGTATAAAISCSAFRRKTERWNCCSAGTRRPGPFDPFWHDRSKKHLSKKEAIL